MFTFILIPILTLFTISSPQEKVEIDLSNSKTSFSAEAEGSIDLVKKIRYGTNLSDAPDENGIRTIVCANSANVCFEYYVRADVINPTINDMVAIDDNGTPKPATFVGQTTDASGNDVYSIDD